MVMLNVFCAYTEHNLALVCLMVKRLRLNEHLQIEKGYEKQVLVLR